jgi:hypothetical protein
MTKTNIIKETIFVFLFIVLITSVKAQDRRPIGTNISRVKDWSTELVFVDVFKQCRKWISYEKGGAWDSGVNVPLGVNGYPVEIPYNDKVHPPQHVKTLLLWGIEGKFPEGNYRFIVSGKGKITLSGAANGTFACPFDGAVQVDNSKSGIILEIDSSLVSDPVHDIRLIMPGFENTYLTNPFNPAFIDFLTDFQVIRFMDFMQTNNSPVTSWNDRNQPDYYTQTLENGVAYEYMVKLCNRTKTDAWVCIPHGATDEFISEMAAFLKQSLAPELKIYIEYSNEVWNGIFSQNGYAKTMGESLGYSGKPWEQGWKFYAKRTADIHRIFETEFGNTDRLIKVIAVQAANDWVSNFIIDRYEETEYNPSGVTADALAIAPYFGGGLADAIGDNGLIASTTVDDILDSLENSSLEIAFTWMAKQKTIADNHNLKLVTYEGGQHLVTYSYRENQAFVDTLIAVNRNPEMENLYCAYFNYWYNTVQGGLFCNFSSHRTASKYGSWGVKEFMNDTLAPKYLGLKNCVFKFNTTPPSQTEIKKRTQNLNVYPIPAKDGILNISHKLDNPVVALCDIAGKSIDYNIIYETQNNLSIKVKRYTGFAILTLKDNCEITSKPVVFTR